MMDMLKNREIVAKLASLAAALILGAAYIFQYGFGYEPCALCWNQRYPYMVVIALGIVASFTGLFKKAWYLAGLVILFAVDAAYAGYHAGVEQKWWAGPSTCTGGGLTEVPTDLMASLTTERVPMCDEIPWDLFGISMAGYNFLMASALTLVCLYALLKGKR